MRLSGTLVSWFVARLLRGDRAYCGVAVSGVSWTLRLLLAKPGGGWFFSGAVPDAPDATDSASLGSYATSESEAMTPVQAGVGADKMFREQVQDAQPVESISDF